jgi:hypothetical protein
MGERSAARSAADYDEVIVDSHALLSGRIEADPSM